MSELDRLKEKMSSAFNVRSWNALREEAKDTYSIQAIRDLDSSGYIHRVLKS